jgi:hypothetical protein
MKKRVLITSVLLLLTAATSPASAAAEEDVVVDAASERAESLAALARDELGRGDTQKAIQLYNEAYAAAPAAILLFNIAAVHDQTLKAGEALTFYRRAVSAGDLDPALVARANERIAALEKAEAPIILKPMPKSAEDRGWHPLRIAGVVSAGTGVVALGVTGILAAIAKSKDSDAESFCDGDRCTNPRALELTDDARGLASAATVMFVTGAVLVAGGVVLWLVAPPSSSTKTQATSTASSLGRFTW